MGELNQKKILFLASWYPSDENPSLGNFVQKHAEFANQVAEVHVLYAVSSSRVSQITLSDEVVNNVRTIIVYYPSVRYSIPIISQLSKKRAYQIAMKKGYEHLNSKYDLVHLNAVFPAGVFARWLKSNYKIPYVATVHWTGFLDHQKSYEKLPFYLKNVYEKIFKEANEVFPVSEHLGQSLINHGLINDFRVLNNVVSSNYFYPSKEMKDENEPQRFIHISSFKNEHKNVSGMLSAFSNLTKDYVLHIITEGDEKEVWEAIKTANVPIENCIVESKLSSIEVGEALRKADCLVLFSNYETFSVILAEAWMCGTPAIYSKCGGLTEINNPEIGIQIQPKNTEQLTIALENFSTSHFSAKVIHDFSLQFSDEHLLKTLANIYLKNS